MKIRETIYQNTISSFYSVSALMLICIDYNTHLYSFKE
nr:MAG TPA: hypothetical protein [Bacteriophage sp.]